MESNQQSNTEQEPKNPDTPLSSSKRQDAKREEQPQHEADRSSTPQQEPVQVVIQKQPNNNWTIANLIAFIAVIVSGLLFYFTYRLFEQASIQSTAATKSATAAENTVEVYRKMLAESHSYDINSLAKQDSAFKSNNKSAKDNFDLQKQFLKGQRNLVAAQMKSIEEAQIEFENANKPYIYYNSFKSDTFRDQVSPHIKLIIKNFGKTPAYIYYIMTKESPSRFEMQRSFKYNYQNVRKRGFLLASNAEDTIPFFTRRMNSGEFHGYKSEGMVYVIHGEVVYSDVTKKKKEVYKFCYLIDSNGRFIENSIHNGIDSVKKEDEILYKFDKSILVPNSP